MIGARSHARQDGQVAVMFALVLALVLSGVIALVGNVIVLYDIAGRYDNGALVGAQAGASQVDTALLRQGQVVLDPGRAASVCMDAAAMTSGLDRAEIKCLVSPDARSVTAHLSRRVPLVFASYGPGITITRDHTGAIGVGESQGTTP